MSAPPPKIAIVYYSMHCHIAKMAEAIKDGIEGKGGQAMIFRIHETLPQDILEKLHATNDLEDPEKPPIATGETLAEYDAFIFEVPTRYGNMLAQWKTYWDATGKLGENGALAGTYAGVFVSTGTPGGGQEMTVANMMSTLVHHGIVFVPLGYASGLSKLTSFKEIHGGSPWGAGTFTKFDESRIPSIIELEIAKVQGGAFFKTVSLVDFSKPLSSK
ncbi:hypothetical protein D9619_006805 [Psilocybe cf. subviscida]|uniref:Flavodoxin-like domain-containing protein n=1 Tax=Psilocybe cf. subviscida TaxID=2480587 RepID=A0A8H5B4P2_9AGAR|nr:hypothetical protein D9619_006805 [Psilocybe cf. subviscida]